VSGSLVRQRRYRACLKVLVEPQFVEDKGKDALAFVVSRNRKWRPALHDAVGVRPDQRLTLDLHPE
jgi:hypothetical protein